jgi:hypothetical protein
MKLYKYLIAGVIGTIAISSCTNLDETPYTFVDPSSFYKNEEQLDEALLGVYNQFRSLAGHTSNIMRLECCTDFAQPNRTDKDNIYEMNDWFDINNGTDASTFTKVWASAYTCINRANTVLTRGEGLDIDATTKARIFAQARFLRGYSYYWLVRLFGGVPISSKMTENLSGLEIPRNSVDEVYAQIISDWEYAEANLPVKGTSDYDVWRVSQGAVDALLGDLYLFRGSMNNSQSDFQKSVEYSKKVIDSKAYQLLPDYKDLWYAFNPKGAKNNAESIFELQYMAINGQSCGMHRMFGTFGDSYYNAEGGSYMYLRVCPSVEAWQSYNSADKRLDVFVTKGNAKKGSKTESMEFDPNDLGKIPGSKNWKCAGPGNAKYYDFTTDPSSSSFNSNNNWMDYRYSQVLLNYAEALNHVTPGSADALAALNMVHQRAGLTPLSTTDSKALDDSIFQERAWEFIGEGKLYYDELRTDRLGPRVYNFIKKYHTMGYAHFTRPVQFVPQKSFLWKIPSGDLDSNPALVQNPDNVSYPGYTVGE